jgi:hypothetical protein
MTLDMLFASPSKTEKPVRMPKPSVLYVPQGGNIKCDYYNRAFT